MGALTSGHVIAIAILVACVVVTAWYAGRARRAIWLADDMAELQDRMTKLESRQKLTQGRLNSIAPPREGTGAVVDPAGARPATRADLYAAVIRRNRDAG